MNDRVPIALVRRVASSLRRHWILTTLVVIALAVRIALPEVLRRVVEAQAPAVVRARVELGDVDLWLLWGGVALEDVAVRSPEGGEPLLAWKQLYVRVSWVELLRRTVLLRQVLLVEPRVDLERLADGGTNFGRILPDTTPQGEPVGPAGEPWRFALEELRIESGQIDFEDVFVKASKPVRVAVRSLAVKGGAFATALEGEVRIAAALLVEGAPVELEAALEPGPEPLGVKLAARLNGEGLPIDHGIAYSPYGWEDLRGRLDAALEWELDGERSAGRGRLALRDVEVKPRGADVAGASWAALEVEVDALDLAAREARLARIRWVKPSVVLEPGEPVPLPVLRSVAQEAIVEPAAEAAAAGGEAAAPAAARPSPGTASEERVSEAESEQPPAAAANTPTSAEAAPAEAVERWRWSIAALAVEEMRVLSRAQDRRTDLGLSLEVEELADPSERPASFELQIAPEVGRLTAKGKARIAPLEASTEIEWQDLDLPALLATWTRPELVALRSARSSGRLQVGSTEDGGLAANGELSLSGVSYEDGLPNLSRLEWQRLDAAIESIALPGVLSGAIGAPSIGIESLQLSGAKIGVVREPAEDAAGSGPAPSAGDAETGAPAAAPVSAPEPGSGESTEETLRVSVRDLAVSDSELSLIDRALGAPVRAEIAAIDLRARGVVWPGVKLVDTLALRMEGPAGAQVRLDGEGRGDSSRFSLNIDGLELVPFETYAGHYGGLTIDGGTADLAATLDLGESRYDSESRLVLHDLGLSGDQGEASFEKRFGVPLGLALALLRDVQGDITLDLHMSGGREGGGVGIGKVLTRTLRRVLVNALASPLKLIGSVALAGGAIGKFAVEPVPFLPGTSDPAPEAEEQVSSLAKMLAERPELALRLEGRVAAADLVRLREGELPRLLADPESRASKALRAMAEKDDTRAEAVQELLAKRAAAPAETSVTPDLEKLLATVELPRDRLVALGLDRAERVRAGLLSKPGVAPEQIELRTGTAEARAKQPRVIVKLDARASGGSSPTASPQEKQEAAPR